MRLRLAFEAVAGLELVGRGELRHRYGVLVGMAGPCAVHQRVSLVLLVFFEHGESARVQLRIFAAGIERGHAADGEDAAAVAYLGHQLAEALEKWHVMRNRV